MSRKRRSRNKGRFPRKSWGNMLSLSLFVFASLLFLNQNVPKLRAVRSGTSHTRHAHFSHKHASPSSSKNSSIHATTKGSSFSTNSSHSHHSEKQHTPSSQQTHHRPEIRSGASVRKYKPAKNIPPPTKPRPIYVEVPHGPIPLPNLPAPNDTVQAGTSWTASFAAGILSALPLHWMAELSNRAPNITEVPTYSIFTARRKGAWIGCHRPYHLVCKGAYRAIKNTDAITVVDVSCDKNTYWLPYVIDKLRTEFRLVQLTCIGDFVKGYGDDTKFIKLDPERMPYPNGTDMVIAYKNLERGNLISAMRFYKNVKKSDVKTLLTENFPDEENIVQKIRGGSTKLQVNTGAAPFWFPTPQYEYENEEENEETVPMQIVATQVAEMFEEKFTPDMSELVDPRKRTVTE